MSILVIVTYLLFNYLKLFTGPLLFTQHNFMCCELISKDSCSSQSLSPDTFTVIKLIKQH